MSLSIYGFDTLHFRSTLSRDIFLLFCDVFIFLSFIMRHFSIFVKWHISILLPLKTFISFVMWHFPMICQWHVDFIYHVTFSFVVTWNFLDWCHVTFLYCFVRCSFSFRLLCVILFATFSTNLSCAFFNMRCPIIFFFQMRIP